MKKITGAKLVILDQVFQNGHGYVKVVDLITYLERGVDNLKACKVRKLKNGDTMNKDYRRGYQGGLEKVISRMKILEYGYPQGQSTGVNIPNTQLQEVPNNE